MWPVDTSGVGGCSQKRLSGAPVFRSRRHGAGRLAYHLTHQTILMTWCWTCPTAWWDAAPVRNPVTYRPAAAISHRLPVSTPPRHVSPWHTRHLQCGDDVRSGIRRHVDHVVSMPIVGRRTIIVLLAGHLEGEVVR